MDKEQIIIDGIIINACLVSEKCKEFETCKIKNILRQLARKTQEYNNLANILHATTIYPEICDRCKDEILIYPMISGKTSYTDHEVDLETLIAIVDRLKYKTQECEELKKKIETYKCSTNCHKYIEADRYLKALEEIERICLQDKDISNVCLIYTRLETPRCKYDIQDEILDIISKARGEGNNAG